MNRLKALGTVLGTVAGLVLAYLALAFSAGYWPYGGTGVTITSPAAQYRIAGDFPVVLAGELPRDTHLWVVARDANQAWYPLTEVAHGGGDTWTGTVRKAQVTTPVDLCAVSADPGAQQDLAAALRGGSGLPRLPSGADQLDCRPVLPES